MSSRWNRPVDNIEKAVLKPAGTEMRSEDRKAPYSEEVEKRRTGPSPAAEAEEEPEADRAEWRPEEEPWEWSK
jgi:hypothetical protein